MEKYILQIKEILRSARQNAYYAVNVAMLEAYWQIGREIALQRLTGENTIKKLSIALTEEFGRGYSVANLKNFRQFYCAFPEFLTGYSVSSQISWTHYRLLMRVDDPKARAYYIQEASAENWSVRQLERNINTFYYQRILSTGKTEPAIKKTKEPNIQDFIKDPYIFEFLNIEVAHTQNERKLETALIDNLQQFLLELGKGFTFLGRQFRISSETEHYYIDLVFYNYILKCFVLFDLKTDKLTHQDIGQMDMYRRMFDDLKKQDNDNPTIGIILCTQKSETVVKYSVISDNQHLFATEYMPYLPTEAELIAAVERQMRWLESKNDFIQKEISEEKNDK